MNRWRRAEAGGDTPSLQSPDSSRTHQAAHVEVSDDDDGDDDDANRVGVGAAA